MQRRRRTPVATSLALLCLLPLGACGGAAPGKAQGEWTGTLHTEKGRCPDALPSRLLVDGAHIAFVPGSGVLVLKGTRAPGSNRLHAQLQLSDSEHKPLPMVFEGTLSPDGTRVDGTYGTPACRASVVLAPPAHDGLQRMLGN